jgi:hypothetical protein
MKYNTVTRQCVGLVALAALIAAPGAYAASKLSSACKSDIKKFKCTGKTDAELHECLEKNEQEGKPNEGFTKACYQAHEAYEKANAKSEKEEHEAGEAKQQ